MHKRWITGALCCGTLVSWAQEKPNIIIINADDLGYGDVSCNNPSCRVNTHNIDHLAAQGLRFENMHATSATSTPSRFSLLTGTYAWRVPGTGVARGDAAMIITPQMNTIPKMLKSAGYVTAAVGKWHLGLGDESGKQDWNGTITPGLCDIGFDYSYIMAATADRVPCVYIENGRVVGLDPKDPIQVSYTTNFEGQPTGALNPELLTKQRPSHGHDGTIVNGISRIGFMSGGHSARWSDETIADSITSKALNFIRLNQQTPFFLYLATNDIHVPRYPHSRFIGQSGMGVRGDAILEFDWTVGQVVGLLDSLNLTDNTLIIITSDNGPVVDDGYKDHSLELLGEHRPSGGLRGGKYGIYEGGTRVLGVVSWRGHITAAKVSRAPISHVDFYRSLSSIVGQDLQPQEAADSQDISAALMGKTSLGRSEILEHAYTYSITVGPWKYIMPSRGMKVAWQTGNPTGNSPEPQLFNLKNDPAEKVNRANELPRKVAFLAHKLEVIINKKD
ncbi:MAG: arylsulfatase [Mucinivorans sp.]